MIASLSNLGLGFSLPMGQLLVFMAVAVLVGIVGSIAPARKASHVDVLKAIGHE